MNIKYAVFDMDGTLLDTMPYWHGIYPKYMQMMGCENCIDEETLLKIDYLTTDKAIALLKEKYNCEAIQKLDEAAVYDVMEEFYNEVEKPRDGVLNMLELLKQNGAKLCVASATPTKLVKLALINAGIYKFFDFILSPDDFPLGKRSPEIFICAAERFGCKVSELTLFEDALYSMKTAKSLGMQVVAVKDQYETRHFDEIAETADVFYSEFTEFKL